MNPTGYRTVILFGIATVAGIFGHHLPPEVLQQYSTDVIALIGVAGVALRLITNTPFGQKEVAKLEASGIVPEDIVQQVLANLPQQGDWADLRAQVAALKQALDAPAAAPVTSAIAAVPVANGGGQINQMKFA